ncbi:MAG: flippase-like domain-containing protein [Chthoniobacterales bacterium]
MKRWILLFLQSAVTIGLLCWLFRDGSMRSNFVSMARQCDLRWLAAGFAACGILNILGIFRWRIFLNALDIDLSLWRSTQLYFIGAFFNLVMVGSVGGDAVKAGYLIADGNRKTTSLFSVLLDRISGFGALIVASVLFITLRYEWLMQSPVVARLIYFVFAFLSGAALVLGFSFVISVTKIQHRLPKRIPFRKGLVDIADAYSVFFLAWRGSLLAGFLSFIMLMCYFLTFYFCSQSVRAGIGFMDFFAIMPAVDIITALPISLGGLGVREQLFETLLGQLCGTATATALLISLGGFLLNAVWSLLGACFLPFYHVKNSEEERAMSDYSLCWKIARKFARKPELQYYAFCKLRIDPAFQTINTILKNSTLPLLDVGCGVCLLGSYLQENGCVFPVRGIDIDERKINYASKTLDYPNVTLELGSATDLPDFSGNIAVLDVIHYFDDATQNRILHAIADRVVPGGCALIRIAIKDSSWRYGVTWMEEIFTRAVRWIRSGQINFPTMEEVKGPFEKRGFQVRVSPLWGCTPFNSYFFECYRPLVNEEIS